MKRETVHRIFLACGYTDLRYGVDGLARVVEEEFELKPFDKGTLFLFCGRRSDRIKGLLWEGDGFLLLYKRLDSGRFKWPRHKRQAQEMSAEDYRRLMDGMTIFEKKTTLEIHPKHV